MHSVEPPTYPPSPFQKKKRENMTKMNTSYQVAHTKISLQYFQLMHLHLKCICYNHYILYILVPETQPYSNNVSSSVSHFSIGDSHFDPLS